LTIFFIFHIAARKAFEISILRQNYDKKKHKI
jgi:hypothetical protein